MGFYSISGAGLEAEKEKVMERLKYLCPGSGSLVDINIDDDLTVRGNVIYINNSKVEELGVDIRYADNLKVSGQNIKTLKGIPFRCHEVVLKDLNSLNNIDYPVRANYIQIENCKIESLDKIFCGIELHVTDCNLRTLKGLMRSPDKILKIIGCNELVCLDGCPDIEGLTISDCSKLTSLAGMGRVDKQLDLRRNKKLINFKGMNVNNHTHIYLNNNGCNYIE